jgi:hypothetical protein
VATYFQLDSAVFEAWLTSLGFTKTTFHNEVVFERQSKASPDIVIKVYSSSSIGDDSARDVGKDAIRSVAILYGKDGKTYPICKTSRVYRTTSQESIHQRTLQRIEEAEARCAEWKQNQDAKHTAPERSTPVEYMGAYVGSMGEELRRTVKVVARMPWNDKFMFTLRDKEGQGDTFCYWTEKDLLQVNETYDLRFKIVGHRVFKGVHQNTVKDVFGKRVVV